MAKKCYEEREYRPIMMPRPANNCICSFPTLVILILIVLQFSRYGSKGCCHDDDEDIEDDSCCCKGYGDQIGNGILFIIALFFLSCAGAGCPRPGIGGY